MLLKCPTWVEILECFTSGKRKSVVKFKQIRILKVRGYVIAKFEFTCSDGRFVVLNLHWTTEYALFYNYSIYEQSKELELSFQWEIRHLWKQEWFQIDPFWSPLEFTLDYYRRTWVSSLPFSRGNTTTLVWPFSTRFGPGHGVLLMKKEWSNSSPFFCFVGSIFQKRQNKTQTWPGWALFTKNEQVLTLQVSQ